MPKMTFAECLHKMFALSQQGLPHACYRSDATPSRYAAGPQWAGGDMALGDIASGEVLYLFKDVKRRDREVNLYPKTHIAGWPTWTHQLHASFLGNLYHTAVPAVTAGVAAQALSSYDRCYADAVKAAAGATPWACHRTGSVIQANGESWGIRGNPNSSLVCNIAPGIELYLHSTQYMRDRDVRSGGIVMVGWPLLTPGSGSNPPIRRSALVSRNAAVMAPVEKIDYMKHVREICGGR